MLFVVVVLFQDSDTSATDSFVPTVTAISTSPDLSWMVQPTVITSVSPSSGRARTRSRRATQPSSPAGANKAKPCSRKGQREQVCHKRKKEKENRKKKTRWVGGGG